jgi:hypothetical protein
MNITSKGIDQRDAANNDNFTVCNIILKSIINHMQKRASKYESSYQMMGYEHWPSSHELVCIDLTMVMCIIYLVCLVACNGLAHQLQSNIFFLN